MKRLVYYLIFLLALVMMMLACSACRSPKTVTYSQVATDSVKLSVRDSSSQRFEFTFDSLELWSDLRNYENSETRSSQAQPSSDVPNLRSSGNSHHIVVYGGKLQTATTTLTSQDSSSIKTTKENRTTKIRPSPSSLLTSHYSLLTLLFLLILFALAIVLFLLYKIRSKVLP